MRYLIVIAWCALAVVAVGDSQEGAVLEIGLRSSHFEVLDSTRGGSDPHFLGSIDNLIEQQDYMPVPYMNVRFGAHWALGLGYDDFDVKTWSLPDGAGEIGHTDGTIEIAGPTLSVQWRYPNESRYTPFAEASLLIYRAFFDALPEWRDARGDKNSHILELDDDNGYRLGIGCDIRLAEDWALVLTWERTFLEVDVAYYLYGRVRERGTFPLDQTRCGIGVKYAL